MSGAFVAPLVQSLSPSVLVWVGELGTPARVGRTPFHRTSSSVTRPKRATASPGTSIPKATCCQELLPVGIEFVCAREKESKGRAQQEAFMRFPLASAHLSWHQGEGTGRCPRADRVGHCLLPSGRRGVFIHGTRIDRRTLVKSLT